VQQGKAVQDPLEVHDLPGNELGDREADDVTGPVDVGDDASHLTAGEPTGYEPEP
jgi:hypothetical protein